MTVTTHVYDAWITGSPTSRLSIIGGDSTLDESRAPHVTATITIAVPTLAILAALDPRTSAPPRVTITANSSGGSARVFDLGVRRRSISARERTIVLELASDEALLDDYAPLTDDASRLDAFQTSTPTLRDVVNYVIGKAIPGAALQRSALTADVRPYWAVTNLLTNPSFEKPFSAQDWMLGGNSRDLVQSTGAAPVSGSQTARWTAVAAAGSYLDHAVVRVAAERSYVFALSIVATAARPTRLIIRWRNDAGVVIRDDWGLLTTVATQTWTRLAHIRKSPEGATQASLYVEYQASAAGQVIFADAAMFYEGDRLVPYFDGNSVGGGYAYAWSGDAHASTSTRSPLVTREPESLIWRSGQTAMEFLAPLVQTAGFRLVCDELRRWTLRDEHWSEPGALALRYGVNLIDADDAMGRSDGLWFDAAVTVYEWTATDGTQRTETDYYALNQPHTRLMRFERSTPYPGPGFSQYAVRRAQGRGREITATAVADWSARVEQPVTVTLENAPLQTGQTARVQFDFGRDEMTVTTRTTDTPADAIDLLPGSINQLTGNIDQLTAA